MLMTSPDNPRIGVLLAQLGTPDAPTAGALRPYLRQFLSDRRVVDYPPLLWQPILNLFILAFRPRRSAALYRRVWLEGGSPLLVYSQAQTAGVAARLGDSFRVVLGMRYGHPSIAQAMRTLRDEGIERVLVLPLFPQYSSTTTASIYDAVFAAAAGPKDASQRFVPALRFVPAYYDHPGYIAACAARVWETVATGDAKPDRTIFSFHGVPERYVTTGDPYRAQCEVTARLLAAALNLPDDRWMTVFQSQFGPEQWLQPATDTVLTGLHREGVERVVVFSPGFTTDCLETLDELGHEGREQFAAGGGSPQNYHLAPCLNDHALWLDTMAAIIRHEAAGWV
jgi:ferrochelatase